MVKAGDVILQANPFAHVLAGNERGLRCDSCLKRCESIKKCTRCQFMRYCNVNCQKMDWSVHKMECICLNRVSPNIPLDSVRLMLRLVIKYQSKHAETTDHEGSKWSRQFHDLMSHSEEIQADLKRRDQFSQIVYTLKQLMGDDTALPSLSELLQIFGKMTVNTFTIYNGELQSIGAGIYLSPSLLDHRCQPNAVITFCGSTLYLRATEDIQDPQPNNTFISYIDQISTTKERQQQLLEQYYFVCECDRCRDIYMDKLMTSVRCPKTGCTDGCVHRNESNKFSPCTSCGTNTGETFMKAVIQFEENCQSQVEAIKRMKKEQCYKNVLETCEKCFNIHQHLFQPYNLQFVHLVEEAFDACIHICSWEKSLFYGEKVLMAYRKLSHGKSPNLGIYLMKVGKIQVYLSKLSDASRSLQQAEKIIAVTHGQEHETYKELVKLLQQTQAELYALSNHKN